MMKLRSRRLKLSLARRARFAGPTYTLYCHPSIEADVRKLAGFKAGRQHLAFSAGFVRRSGFKGHPLLPSEVGTFENVRIIASKPS